MDLSIHRISDVFWKDYICICQILPIMIWERANCLMSFYVIWHSSLCHSVLFQEQDCNFVWVWWCSVKPNDMVRFFNCISKLEHQNGRKNWKNEGNLRKISKMGLHCKTWQLFGIVIDWHICGQIHLFTVLFMPW